MLIPERPRATGRAEGDLLTAAFQLQCVTRFQLQLLSQGLGNDDSAGFVNDETSVHSGIIIWVDPKINAIYISEEWR